MVLKMTATILFFYHIVVIVVVVSPAVHFGQEKFWNLRVNDQTPLQESGDYMNHFRHEYVQRIREHLLRNRIKAPFTRTTFHGFEIILTAET